MTSKERRLTFAYSKLCDINNLMYLCKNLLCGSAYDKELMSDEKTRNVWYKLIDIEKQILKLKYDFGTIVDSITEDEKPGK